MAGTKSDGSITIDTKLDNTGFSKGSNELKHAVKSLTDQVNATGGQLRNAFKFDFGQPKQAVNSFSRAIKQVNEEISGLGELGRRAIEGDEEALARFRSESGETLNKLQEMRTELEKFGSTEFMTPEFEKAAGQYQKAATQVDELSKSLEQAEAAFEKLTNDFGRSSEYTELEDKIEVLRMYKKEYDEAMRRGDSGAAARAYMDAGVGKGSFEDAIKRAEAELDKLWEKFENSAPYKTTQKEIDKISQNLEKAQSEAARYKEIMDSTPASFEGYESTEYEKDQAALQKTIDKLLEYRQLVREGVGSSTAPSAEWEAVQQKWQSMTTMSGIIKNTFSTVFGTIASGARTVGSALSTGITHPIQLVDRALGGVAAGAWKAVSSLGRLAGTAIVSGIRKIADSAKKAALHLASMAKTSIINGLKKLGNAIASVGRRSKRTNVSLSGGFKTMLKYGLGIRSLFVLFNKLRRAIVEGFGALAEQDAAFGQTVNNFKSALTNLKMSFAAAFAPIAEIVLPLLTSLINGLSETISKIGQLVAALTGRTTFKRAITNQSNLASNTGDATDAMDEEAKAAKKAQKTLAGFDDVQILNDNKQDPKKNGSGGASGGFEELPIENQFQSLADALKEMWKMADFTELGRMLGQGLKDALDKIPWDYIKSVAARLGKSLATLMNGFLEVPGLFTAIGNAIAQGINTIFSFLDAFVTNFHWASLGKAIKDLILGMLNNIDWPLIYHTISTLGAGMGTALENALNNPEIWTAIFSTVSKGLNTIIYGIDSFLKAVNWASLGANIGTGLNNGVEAFDWGALSQTLIDLVNGAFNLWYNFVTTFDFRKFGTHIGTSLSNAVKGIDWAKGGASVAETINGLFSALAGFIKSTDWKALGKAVVDAIAGFFGNLDWATVGELLSAAITALFNFFAGVFEEIDWTALPGKIVEAIGSFLKGFDWTEVAEAVGELIGASFKALIEVGSTLWEAMKSFGKNIMEGGFQGIKDALASIGEWIKTNIFDPFIAGFKAAFGIESPSKEMMPLGGYIIKGLLQGIIDGLVNIGTWIKTNITDPIVNGVKSMFGLDGEESALVSVGKDLIAGFKAGVGSIMTSIGSWIKTVITDPIVNGIKSLFGLDGEESVLVSVGKNLLEGLKSGLLGAMDGIGDWIDNNITGPICGFFKNLFGINSPSTVFSGYGGYLIAGLKEGLLNNISGIGDWISNHITGPICSHFKRLFGINSPSTVFSGYGGYLMEGLKQGVEDKQSLPQTALSNAQTAMQNAFGALKQLTQWAKIGGDMMSLGLKAGMALKVPSVIASVTTIESNLRGAVTKNLSNWKTAAESLMTQLKAGMEAKKNDLNTAVTTIVNSIKEKFESAKTTLYAAGQSLISEVERGMGSSNTFSYTVSRIASSISTSFNNQNWYSLGSNIGNGIYNGLIANSYRLSVLAWNTAVDMYNSACRALGIASPSKEFAWIGEMITEGLGGGIEATQENAVGAVTDLANAVTQEAEDSKPFMQIDTSIGDVANSLDGVLSTFSDKVVQSFSTMISAMEEIVNGSAFTMPAVAGGSVMPYSARRASSQGDGDRLSSVLEELALRDSERLTRNDLVDIFTNLFRQYLDINFYLGDEQLARHANAGNMKLNRRYSTTT